MDVRIHPKHFPSKCTKCFIKLFFRDLKEKMGCISFSIFYQNIFYRMSVFNVNLFIFLYLQYFCDVCDILILLNNTKDKSIFKIWRLVEKSVYLRQSFVDPLRVFKFFISEDPIIPYFHFVIEMAFISPWQLILERSAMRVW